MFPSRFQPGARLSPERARSFPYPSALPQLPRSVPSGRFPLLLFRFRLPAAALSRRKSRSTPFPFRIFKTQHFVCDEERLVVTAADPATRTVSEINGLPAAEFWKQPVEHPHTEAMKKVAK